MADIKHLKKVLSAAKTKKRPHESEIDEGFRFTYPSRARIEDGSTPDRTSLYDSTAVDAVLNLTTTTMMMLFPRSSDWAYLDWRENVDVSRIPSAWKAQLDKANEVLHQAITECDFYIAANESMKDCIIAGTGCIGFRDKAEGIQVFSIPVSQLFFLENFRGEIDTIIRVHTLTIDQLMKRFGTVVPEEVKRLHNSDPDKKFEIEEYVTPDNKGGYHYTIILNSTKEAKSEPVVLHDKPSKTMPMIAFRWDRITGSVWGESPTRFAIPHIRVVNHWKKLIEKYGEYAALGLWQTQDESVNAKALKGMLEPGTVLPIQAELRVVPFPGNFPITQALLEEERNQVRKLLMADMVAPEQAVNMTAYTFSQLRDQYFKRVGDPALRLEDELLVPFIKSMVSRLQARGKLPETVDQKRLDELITVSVHSAVKRGLAHNEVMRDIQAFQMVAQTFGVQVAQTIVDVEKLAKRTFDSLGMKEEFFRSEYDVKKIKAAILAQQAPALAQALGQENADGNSPNNPNGI